MKTKRNIIKTAIMMVLTCCVSMSTLAYAADYQDYHSWVYNSYTTMRGVLAGNVIKKGIFRTKYMDLCAQTSVAGSDTDYLTRSQMIIYDTSGKVLYNKFITANAKFIGKAVAIKNDSYKKSQVGKVKSAHYLVYDDSTNDGYAWSGTCIGPKNCKITIN